MRYSVAGASAVGRGWPLSALAIRALEAQRVRQAKERLAARKVWSDLGLIFASTIGSAMEPRNVNRRFEQLRAAAGLDWLHLKTFGTPSPREPEPGDCRRGGR